MKLRHLLLAVALLLAAYPLSEGPAFALFCAYHRLSETPSWWWFYRPLEWLSSNSRWFGGALTQYKFLWKRPRTFTPDIDLDPRHLDNSPLTFHITSRRLTSGNIEVTANIIGKLEPAPDNYDLFLTIVRQPGDPRYKNPFEEDCRTVKGDLHDRTITTRFILSEEESLDPDLTLCVMWATPTIVDTFHLKLNSFLPK